jgi:hypothetical protein
MTIADAKESEKSVARGGGLSPGTAAPQKNPNGAEWTRMAELLGTYRTIRTLAKETKMSEDAVGEILSHHSGDVRKSLVNAPSGEGLYIRRDTGITSRIKEVLAIAQLAMK